MYAKLIDGVINFAPKKIKDGDSTTYNPTGEMLEELGYFPVTFTYPPENEPGYVAVCEWEEIDGTIVQRWRVEEAEPTADELLAMLEEIL
ncbi:MAG: hypothetical protein IJG17_06290 [Eubacterium sp.]|nr:hypothetical protein [Eubacterium sp.]